MEKSKDKKTRDFMETEFLKTIFVSLVVSFLVFGILYFFKLSKISSFTSNYGFYIFFAILSYSLLLAATKQVKIYGEFACMSGMMIGMTTGMIAGFLPGFFVGATNGMFYGSIFGMFLGIVFGIWNGKCCGIMGVMEGIMAGFMGGLMGAMTAIMMYNDHLKIAGVIVFLISAAILFGLNLMIKKEMHGIEKKNYDEFLTAFLSLILTVLTIWIIVFGPRSVLFQ